jgi:hypothetical protein
MKLEYILYVKFLNLKGLREGFSSMNMDFVDISEEYKIHISFFPTEIRQYY